MGKIFLVGRNWQTVVTTSRQELTNPSVGCSWLTLQASRSSYQSFKVQNMRYSITHSILIPCLLVRMEMSSAYMILPIFTIFVSIWNKTWMDDHSELYGLGQQLGKQHSSARSGSRGYRGKQIGERGLGAKFTLFLHKGCLRTGTYIRPCWEADSTPVVRVNPVCRTTIVSRSASQANIEAIHLDLLVFFCDKFHVYILPALLPLYS